MNGYSPTLGKDKWLSIKKAEEAMKEQGILDHSFGWLLLRLVKMEKIRCWLCADGKLRFQYNSASEVWDQTVKEATKAIKNP